jgi:TRAP-type uncharacterized transport system substrate-binding protein
MRTPTKRRVLVASGLFVALCLPLVMASQGAVAQSPLPPTASSVGESGKAARLNKWTVSVEGGLLESTAIRIAAELGKALNDGENFRILPVIGSGATENLSDLLYLKGVDISITFSDVFDDFKRAGEVKNIEQRVHFISQLFVGELHVLGRPEIKSLQDLEGKKVGFNTKGAGPTTTGRILFERLGIHVEPVYVNTSVGLEKLASGEFAAILHTVAKPNDFLRNVKPESGIHFIQVPFGPKLMDYYLPSKLTHDDYPNFIPAGTEIETLGIPAVLAVYNWPKGSDRLRRVERFIDYYFERFETLKQASYHPKWKEVNLSATVPGWTRYWVAEEKLKTLKGAVSQDVSQPGTSFPTVRASTTGPGMMPVDEETYREFQLWKQKRQRQQNAH